MSRTQQPANQCVIERIGQEVAHIAPHRHDPVYGRDFLC
jgi:hypothetical protein